MSIRDEWEKLKAEMDEGIEANGAALGQKIAGIHLYRDWKIAILESRGDPDKAIRAVHDLLRACKAEGIDPLKLFEGK
jgi:hypothetical protein